MGEEKSGLRGSGSDPDSGPGTSLAIRVLRDTGLPAARATIFVHGPTVFHGDCDERGELRLPVEAGEYEVMIPSVGFDGMIALYPPEGSSSVETVAVEGERTEVELVAYTGGRLHCLIVDASGEPVDPGGVRRFGWDEERWILELTHPVEPGGRCLLEGLEPRTYGLAPIPGAALFFEPVVVALEAGEDRLFHIQAHAAREVNLNLSLRSHADGPLLPLWLSVDAQMLSPWSPPAHRTIVELHGDSAAKPASLRLFPGRYELHFKTTTFMGQRKQIIEDREWRREVTIPFEGACVPESFEFLLEGLGELAIVEGLFSGPRPEGQWKYSIRYLDADGRKRRRGLFVPEDSFELVVDLARISGRLVEIVQRQESRPEVVLATRRLAPGHQRWELPRLVD